MASAKASTLAPEVAVVDFHHHRGPEVEYWVRDEGQALFDRNDWSLLPFMALSDGAHTMVEDFSYFTLLHKGEVTKPDPPAADTTDSKPEGKSDGSTRSSKFIEKIDDSNVSRGLEGATSLFGISCTRQIRSDKLKRRSADVTRSTVQKAVVVIVPTASGLGELRQRLGAVTQAWFAQEDFSDTTILKEFQDSLIRNPTAHEEGQDHYFGLSLREMIYEFRHQTLQLVKCILLQRKVLFFGSKCERLCMMQFALISLIPGLMKNLQDCADPALDQHAQTATRATSLRTSERESLLAYMGLPLQIFGSGAIFSPYTPLQHLDILASYNTKSYVVGSTNSLLLQQKDRYSDMLINLDESNSVTVSSPSLRAALALSAADRRWIDAITQTVLDTWDPSNPSRPKGLGYSGSEDAIRAAFEEYILSLLSSTSYLIHSETHPDTHIPHPSGTSPSPSPYPLPSDILTDFNPEFLTTWRGTHNFTLFHRLTVENRIFDVTPPNHPTAGGLSVEDVQRRLQQNIAELHLDEKMRDFNKSFAVGRERVGQGVARFWEQVEQYKERREQTRSHRSGEHGATATDTSIPQTEDTEKPAQSQPAAGTWAATLRDRATKVQRPNVDAAQLQVAARENAARAGAYLSSWGTWARDRVGAQRGGGGAAGPASAPVDNAASAVATGSGALTPQAPVTAPTTTTTTTTEISSATTTATPAVTAAAVATAVAAPGEAEKEPAVEKPPAAEKA